MYTEFINPIYAVYEGMPVIIIGARTLTTGTLMFVFIEEDGSIGEASTGNFAVDVRFKDGEWHDVSPGPQSDIIE